MSENKWFKFEVIEKITVQKIYTIRAPSLEEAREMAEIGDTAKEVHVKDLDVVDRVIVKELER